MEYYPWWNDAQKALAEDARKFTDEVLIPICEKDALKKAYPWKALKEIGKKGYFGAQIPAKYGGRAEEWGVTGACIILEELSRAGEVAAPVSTTMIGGVHQILHDGTEDQKKRWLPKLATGELLGSITMTEPFAGSDISAIETTAVRDGDNYIINGKKRYQTCAAAADVYMTYVRTSDKPEDHAKYRHLTALIIEKGTKGFTIERVNDLVGLDGIYNVYMDYSNAKIPVSNRIGEEGAGWAVMMSGLNVERVCGAAGPLGAMREGIRYAAQHLQRRIQFGRPTGDLATNQFKLSDMIWRLKIARILTYYAAYCCDLGRDVPVEAAISKMFNTDMGLMSAIDAVQLMGGNGVTKLYPVERLFRDGKLSQIAAGTSEVLKLLIYRQGLREMMPDLKVPYRVMDEELQVPLPAGKLPAKKKVSKAEDVLKVLAEDYRVNPGLYMTVADLKDLLDVADADLAGYVIGLEKEGLAAIYKDRKGNPAMVRATYKGLAAANPSAYYRHIPSWVDPKDTF
jgi:alkylation response protein AidB-like acyl-CoA dehydrogenase